MVRVMLGMIRFISQFEIFNSIIKFITIFVVDFFAWFKVSAKSILHHKAVLHHIILFCSVWMARAFNVFVPFNDCNSTFPVRIKFKRKSITSVTPFFYTMLEVI